MENSLECGRSMQQSLKLMADLLSGDTKHAQAFKRLTNGSCHASSPCLELHTDLKPQPSRVLAFLSYA